jgi:hypothetical protein
MNRKDLVNSLAKTANKKEAMGVVSLIPALASSAIALPSLFRTMGNMNTKRKADNAWAEALMEDPEMVMVPGLEEEFKNLYFDSPYAAKRLLQMY